MGSGGLCAHEDLSREEPDPVEVDPVGSSSSRGGGDLGVQRKRISSAAAIEDFGRDP